MHERDQFKPEALLQWAYAMMEAALTFVIGVFAMTAVVSRRPSPISSVLS
jgi:hypothetical protein